MGDSQVSHSTSKRFPCSDVERHSQVGGIALGDDGLDDLSLVSAVAPRSIAAAGSLTPTQPQLAGAMTRSCLHGSLSPFSTARAASPCSQPRGTPPSGSSARTPRLWARPRAFVCFRGLASRAVADRRLQSRIRTYGSHIDPERGQDQLPQREGDLPAPPGLIRRQPSPPVAARSHRRGSVLRVRDTRRRRLPTRPRTRRSSADWLPCLEAPDRTSPSSSPSPGQITSDHPEACTCRSNSYPGDPNSRRGRRPLGRTWARP